MFDNEEVPNEFQVAGIAVFKLLIWLVVYCNSLVWLCCCIMLMLYKTIFIRAINEEILRNVDLTEHFSGLYPLHDLWLSS